MSRYSHDRFVSWDIGGPLRDSAESMGYALKTATKESGIDLTLNNRLMWQLWTIKGPIFPGSGGDYKAWFKAAYSIEIDAAHQKRTSDQICKDLFESEDPAAAVAEVTAKYGADEKLYGLVGERSVELFGKDPVTMSKSRANDGALEAVGLLYKHETLMGIVSSAPSIESTLGFIHKAIRDPLVDMSKIAKNAVLFQPKLVYFGKTVKDEQLEDSVVTAAEILGVEPKNVWYIADTNDDITGTAIANKRLKEKGLKPVIRLAMVKNGMGVPKMWEKVWKSAGMELNRNYFEVENAENAAALILTDRID